MHPELARWLKQDDGIGEQLRDLRVTAGFTGSALAEEIGAIRVRVSKIENGHVLPKAEEVERWAKACKATKSHTSALLALAAEGRTVHLEHRHRVDAYSEVNKLYVNSADIVFYSPVVYPGELQTPDYARAVIELFERQRGEEINETDLARAVLARAERFELMTDSPDRQYHFLVDQGAAAVQPGGPDVAADQLNRLAKILEIPNVRFGVVPVGQSIPLYSFGIFDDETVLVELLTTPMFHRGAGKDVDTYKALADNLAARAVYGADGLELLGGH